MFVVIYLVAGGIYWLVMALAVGERARAFKTISPGMLPPLGIIFGLFVGFIAAQVWSDFDRANAAVDNQAMALRAVVLLAAFPGKVVVDVHRPFGEQPCRLKGGRSFSDSSPLPFSSCSRRSRALVRIPFARSPRNWLPAHIPHPALHDRNAPPFAARYCTVTLLELAVIARILLRPHRDPASRIAWMVVVGVLPLFGMLAYLLLGEVNIGRRRVARLHAVLKRMPPIPCSPRRGRGGLCSRRSRASPASLSARPFDQRVPSRRVATPRAFCRTPTPRSTRWSADIDAATDHVHVLFYIWLPDNNGRKVVEALKRAAARGVTCRAMADDLGSRMMIRSEHWQAMRAAGVRVAAGLPIGNPLLRPFAGRIDLRNHRKIVVIDDRITYCGSQNCADPEFRVKAKYAPWVDAVMRFEGPDRTPEPVPVRERLDDVRG